MIFLVSNLIFQLTIPTYEIASPEWFYITSAYATPLLVEGRFTRIVSASTPNSPTTVELRMTNRSIAPALRLLHLRPDKTSGEKFSKGAGKFVHCVESFIEIGGPLFVRIKILFIVFTFKLRPTQMLSLFLNFSASLDAGSSVNVFIDVDFCDSTQPLRLNLLYQVESLDVGQEGEALEDEEGKKPPLVEEVLSLEIKPTVGELLQPLDLNPREFVAKQGKNRILIFTLPGSLNSVSVDTDFVFFFI